MIEKVIKKTSLGDKNAALDDLAYWLSKTPEERVAAVDYLRKQAHGDMGRIQKVACVIERPQR